MCSWVRAVVLAVAAGATIVACAGASAGRVDPRALPLGDGHALHDAAKVGYVDTCMASFPSIGGAQTDGPWIDARARTWDSTTKVAVNGAIRWPSGRFSSRVAGGRRRLVFNDLPVGHTTGIFPIASGDPAHAYDQNPNRIATQSFSWSLPLNPPAAGRPVCTGGGPIGVLIDGVVLYNALDGEGRDAAAHEVLDLCAGHPDMSSTYHHHDIPPCILRRARNGRATLVGYALDGYGIYVVEDAHGSLPSNVSLDVCHGTTGSVPWNGRTRRVYHY